MAQSFEDFEGRTVGSTPTDFTPTANGVDSYTIQDVNGRNVLDIETTISTGERPILKFNPTFGGSLANPTEVVVLLTYGSLGGGNGRLGLRVNNTADRNDIDGYFHRASANIDQYSSSFLSNLGSDGITANSGTFWIRLQAEGTQIRNKVWAEGNTEPTTWAVSVTDTTYSSGGFAFQPRQQYEVVKFGIGTNGDAAPTSGTGGGITATLSLTDKPETVSVSGEVKVEASASITESQEVVDANGQVAISGSLSVADSGELVSVIGETRVSGTLALTDQGEVVQATGLVSIEGSLAITDQGEHVQIREVTPPRLATINARLTDAITLNASLEDIITLNARLHD